MSTDYADTYRTTDFRKHPEKYKIGKGEQGVLMAEPYKSEILPHWKFKDPDVAKVSALKITELFEAYKKNKEFVGMDMARKFLQMGFTRSRRYANHASGRKYNDDGSVKPQAEDHDTSPKAESARIFYKYYKKAANDPIYQKMKEAHKSLETN